MVSGWVGAWLKWAGETGDVASSNRVRVDASLDFAWLLLGTGSFLELDWGLVMVSGCAPEY